MPETPNKVALVAGGAQGLGAAAARKLARRGVTVVVADINAQGANSVAADCCAEAPPSFAIVVDLADAQGPEQMVTAVVARAGRLDIVVNCAAAAPAEAFLEMTAAAWHAALSINVRAIALTMAAAGRVMAQTGGGRIINITSAAARMALPNYAAYAASKAAVELLDAYWRGSAQQSRNSRQLLVTGYDGYAAAGAHRRDLLSAGRP